MAEMDEGGQEPVDEREPVHRTGAHSTLSRPRSQLGLVTFVPQRTQIGDEFNDYIGRKPCDPTVVDDHCTSHVPQHSTITNDPEPTSHRLSWRAR
ncbi:MULTISPECIES: hypothetical protein [Streptomyces griseus group]|uniref:hypothetical protein n=1 Tax=Streptomyces griseus group TaxID=629295 RepID=UPI001F1CB2C6|nr:hypothetical protein [Streptomyces baarnensis]